VEYDGVDYFCYFSAAALCFKDLSVPGFVDIVPDPDNEIKGGIAGIPV
jgi:hypothetical protein